MSNSARGELTGRFHWIPELAAHGFDVTFVLPNGEDRYADRIASAGVPVIRYRLERHSVAATDELRTLRDLATILVRHRFSIVHSFGHKANMYAGFAAAFARTHVRFQHVTGLGDPFISGREPTKRRIARMVLKRGYRLLAPTMSAVFFQNADDREHFRFLPPEKAVLTRGTGVNLREYRAEAVSPDAVARLRAELEIDSSHVVVTFVGRLKPEKGLADFVSAARSMASTNPRVMFLIVGEADDLATRAQVSRPTAPHQTMPIRFLGYRDDLREILALTDVFVNPSRREGLPRTNVEAMAMMKPVVTTDVPGCRDTVADGVNGCLVRAGRVDELSSAISRLVSSPELRTRLGREGRMRVEAEFDVAAVVQQVAGVYLRTITERMSA